MDRRKLSRVASLTSPPSRRFPACTYIQRLSVTVSSWGPRPVAASQHMSTEE